MKFSSVLNSALKALGVNKTRTFLTMLGVIIGVFAVVSLVSLVKGVENFIVDRFNSLGSNLIFIAPGRSGFNSDPALAFTNNKLEEKHVNLIRENVGKDLVAVAPSIRLGKNAKYKTKHYYATIAGSNEDAKDLVNVDIEKGRFFTKVEVDANAKVVIIGPTIEKELFGDSNALGKSLKIDDESFIVIGTAKSRGGSQDERVIMPYTTMQDSLDVENFSNIVTKAKNADDIDLVIKKIELALLKDLDKEDFTVLSQASVLESFKSILNVLSIGLAAIAGISLFVGGIGIMNIMLVSVNERIQEIGLRKALGATSRDIGTQFLIEAIFISVLGGLLGLGLGFLVTVISKPWLNAQIPWWAIFLAMGFAIAVGLGFGTYPALKAAKKDPIEALRFE
jgi:putative ABC transport system permease protein